MLISELKIDISLRIHDVGAVEISTAQLLLFINMAVRDLRNAVVLLPLEEDESLTEAATVYTFTVPANFAYVSRLLRQNTATLTYDYEIDRSSWRLALDGGVPALVFDETRYIPDAGAHIKIIGQKRPSIYAADGDTVETFLESLLRERACYYALQFLAAGRSEYAQWRQQEAMLARQEYERLLSMAPQELRMQPNSRYVPTR
jgi:hypothetical protein